MWYVGQKIVCIRELPIKENIPAYQGCSIPKINNVYTIRTIVEGRDGKAAFRLVELRNPIRTYVCGLNKTIKDTEICFNERNFKPLEEKKTDISIFTEMLNKTPKEMVENLKKLNTVEKEHA